MDCDIIFPFLITILLFLYVIFEISLCCICPNTRFNHDELYNNIQYINED